MCFDGFTVNKFTVNKSRLEFQTRKDQVYETKKLSSSFDKIGGVKKRKERGPIFWIIGWATLFA